MPQLRTEIELRKAQSEGAKSLVSYMQTPGFQEQLGRLLPSHLNSDRFLEVALRQLSAFPDLGLCSLRSVAGGIMQAGTLGLEIGTMGECWLLPYENRKTGEFYAQLQIGYMGYMALGWRSSQIVSIQADVVVAGDAFEFQKGVDGYLRHIPKAGRNLKDPGAIEWAYAVIKTAQGGWVWDAIDHETIERLRNSGRSANSPAWRDWYSEMAKAKVLKRTMKLAPKSRELARAIRLDDEADARVPQTFEYDIPLLDAETQAHKLHPVAQREASPPPRTPVVSRDSDPDEPPPPGDDDAPPMDLAREVRRAPPQESAALGRASASTEPERRPAPRQTPPPNEPPPAGGTGSVKKQKGLGW